jgi:hypothetical protein
MLVYYITGYFIIGYIVSLVVAYFTAKNFYSLPKDFIIETFLSYTFFWPIMVLYNITKWAGDKGKLAYLAKQRKNNEYSTQSQLANMNDGCSKKSIKCHTFNQLADYLESHKNELLHAK